MSKFKEGDKVIYIDKSKPKFIIYDFTVSVMEHEYLYGYNDEGDFVCGEIKDCELANSYVYIQKEDIVNNPSHYKTKSGLQAIEVIEAFELNYNMGTVTKYVLRAGKKDPAKHIEDLKKAEFFLKREIATLEKKS